MKLLDASTAPRAATSNGKHAVEAEDTAFAEAEPPSNTMVALRAVPEGAAPPVVPAEAGHSAPAYAVPERLDAHVDCVAHAKDTILVCGWAYHPDAPVEVLLLLNGLPLPAQLVQVVRGRRPDVTEHVKDETRAPLGFVLAAELDRRIETGDNVTLRLRAIQEQRDLELPEPRAFDELAQYFASFSIDERQRVLDICRHFSGALALPDEAPFETLQSFVRAFVEHVHILEGQGVFLQGWLFDPHESVAALRVRSGEVWSTNFFPAIARFWREDVAKEFPTHACDPHTPWGIVAFVPLKAASGEQLQLVATTTTHEVALLPLASSAPSTMRREMVERILANFIPSAPDAFRLLTQHVGPALQATWAALRRSVTDPDVRDFGSVPSKSTYSVIVPVFETYDLIRYQIAHFARDPDFQDTQLVYVIDKPEAWPGALELCRRVHSFFRIPFRVVYPGRSIGPAAAANLGVRCSSGDLIVLVDPEILPKRHGWLERLSTNYRSRETGILGARIVHYDDTIQHDGVVFRPHPLFDQLWSAEHPGKGLPAWLSHPPTTAEVAAVDGKCLMIDRSLYEGVGGLDEDYIFGDFRDSDLCMKVRAAGYSCLVARDEELYLLERAAQSHGNSVAWWRPRLASYNAWRFQQRWGAILEHETADARNP
jgi:GT2 family glycosyltransferase